MSLSCRVVSSRWPTVLFLLPFSVYPQSLCLREARTFPSFHDFLVQDPCGPALFLRIRTDYLDIFGELNVKRGGKGIRIMELEGDDFSQQFVKCQSGGGVWTSNGETRGRATSYRVCGQKIQPFKRGQSPILHGSLQRGDGCLRRKQCVEARVLFSDRGS